MTYKGWYAIKTNQPTNEVPLLFLCKDGFGIKLFTEVDMPLKQINQTKKEPKSAGAVD